MSVVVNGVYSHYKQGTLYKVIGVARNTETNEEEVVYYSLDNYNATGKLNLHARNLDMFNEYVTGKTGVKVPRFKYVYADIEYMSANDYQAKALRTSGDGTQLDKLINGAMGMSGESGEFIDIMKKHIFQGHELDTSHLSKELGDILWYVATTASALGYTLEDIMRTNIQKLLLRYPDGFKVSNSTERKEGDI